MNQISETTEYIYRNIRRCYVLIEACGCASDYGSTCNSCDGHTIRMRWWGQRLPVFVGDCDADRKDK